MARRNCSLGLIETVDWIAKNDLETTGKTEEGLRHLTSVRTAAAIFGVPPINMARYVWSAIRSSKLNQEGGRVEDTIQSADV